MPLYLLLILIFAAVFLGVPVAFSFLIGCTVYLLFDGSFPMTVITGRLGAGLDSFPFLALPLFIFAGSIMSTGGIARRIFKFANSAVGHIPGGLGHVNVLASIIFAGMSGVAQADAAGLGRIEIDEMKRSGYSVEFAAAITAASAVIGPIIPPSGIMVIYAVLSGVALDRLFLGGFLPGFILGGMLMITVYILVKTNKVIAPVLPRAPWQERIVNFFYALPLLFIPTFLIFGLLTGVATPTELGALTVLFAVVVSFVQKELTWKSLFECAVETAKTTGILAILIMVAAPFTWIMGINNAGRIVLNTFGGISLSPSMMLLLIVVILIIAGSFMETTVILLITVPILTPLVTALGIDPTHFGLLIILTLLFGTITPPFGVLLFVVMNLTGLSLTKVSKAILPFYIPMILLLILITFVPDIVTFIPNLTGG